MNIQKKHLFLPILAIVMLVLAACGGSVGASANTNNNAENEHVDDHGEDMENMEDMHMPEDHMGGHDYVPEEAVAVLSPFEATEESISTGADLYATTCAVCHGENGEGDGPAGESLDPKPADLHAEHVQELTEGALFYVISHGKPDTPMPAWENVLDETQRWHVVNFILNLEH